MLILKAFNNFEYCLKVFVNVYMQVTGKLKADYAPNGTYFIYLGAVEGSIGLILPSSTVSLIILKKLKYVARPTQIFGVSWHYCVFS